MHYNIINNNLKVRNWIFSIPKRLRIYFLYDRNLLARLSICAWNVITTYLKSTVPYDDAVPGARIAVQTYGDFLNFNPHLNAIVSDGCFLKDGSFQTASVFMLKDLEETFQYEVLKMLKKEGKTRKVFTALDWLAMLVTHIPSRYEHTVRYYGYFSNKSRV